MTNERSRISGRLRQQRWCGIAPGYAVADAAQRLVAPRAKLAIISHWSLVTGQWSLQSAFDPAAADFSVLCEYRLHVSLLRQQCCLKVNEQGTEASASSMFDLMVQSLPSPCPVIRFDRPFLWLIGDLTTAAPPYFMGLCEQP